MKQLRSIPFLLLAVAVQQANADAIAVNDTATMIQGSGSITIDVLANDSSDNVENNDLFISSYDTISTGYGSVVLDSESNSLIYTPPSDDFVGTDTFTYFVTDDSGYGGVATVTVEVTEQLPEPDYEFEVKVDGARNKAVAAMLGQACNAEGVSNQLGSHCALLAGYEGDLNDIMAQIAPDEALIQGRLLAENNRNKTSRIYQGISQLRKGSGGAQVSINNQMLSSGGAAGDGFGSPWTLLTSIQIENLERDQTWREAGYESSAVGVLLGLGYRVNDSLNIGAAFDFTTYDVDFASNGGSMESDIYSVTGFLSWYKGPLSLDVQAGFGSGDTTAQRRITFPDISLANSDYGSDQINLSSQLEYTLQSGAWALRPFLRLDYLSSKVDAFTETGDSPWLTSAGKQTHEQLNTSLGLDTSYTLTQSWGVMIPGLRVSLVNQSNLSNDPVNFQLIDAGSLGNFQLRSDSADSMFYQWELSSAFVLPNGFSTFISGQVVSSYANTNAYQITGGFNWEF